MGTSFGDNMLGSNLRWTGIPRNTPSRFILKKPEISAGINVPLARTISIGAEFTLSTNWLVFRGAPHVRSTILELAMITVKFVTGPMATGATATVVSTDRPLP